MVFFSDNVVPTDQDPKRRQSSNLVTSVHKRRLAVNVEERTLVGFYRW